MPGDLVSQRFKTPKIGSGMDGSHYPILAVPVILVWLISAWVAFDYGRGRAGYDSGAAEKRLDELREEIRILGKEREQLKRNVASLERESQVRKEAERRLQERMIGDQDEKLALQKEILFLRGVISGKPDKARLRVHDLYTLVDRPTNRYRLKFTIDQSMAGKKRVIGNVAMALVGVDKSGRDKTLKFKNIALNKKQSKMGFLHFQKIDRFFKLPDGFRPVYWRIGLEPTGDDVEGLKERFDWSLKE